MFINSDRFIVPCILWLMHLKKLLKIYFNKQYDKLWLIIVYNFKEVLWKSYQDQYSLRT